MLSQEQQERLRAELGIIWKKRNGEIDVKMVDHCEKYHKYIELDGWFIACCQAKPTINSEMWYDDEQEDPGAGHGRFIGYNMKYAPDTLNTDTWRKYYLMQSYSGHGDAKIGNYYTEREYGEKLPEYVIREFTPEEVKQINAAIEEVRADYRKRLEMYWKKYSDKVYSSGYWVNR